MKGRILIIAGSDPSGGAGVQGDIRTVTALDGYAAAAITALTVQNSLGVSAVHPLAPDLVADQARAVLDDIGADAVKIGMLANGDIARAVVDVLRGFAGPIVVDPVLVSTSGRTLLDHAGVEVLMSKLLPRAALFTPNASEAERLTGVSIRTTDDLRRAAARLLGGGCAAALMKGGHVDGEIVRDVLVTANGEQVFESPRAASHHTHGTGCALSSAAATGLAQGLPLEEAVARAHGYVAEAIRSAPGFGAGAGPIGLGEAIMTLRQWTVDAFASAPFKGNPVCVVEPFETWPDDAWMRALAAENKQPETKTARQSRAEFGAARRLSNRPVWPLAV